MIVWTFRFWERSCHEEKWHLFEIEPKYDGGTHCKEEESQPHWFHDLCQVSLKFDPFNEAAGGKVHSGQRVSGESFNCPHQTGIYYVERGFLFFL